MSLSCGIIGLPNVGKSTLFNALLGRQVADVAEYPFCTIEPNVGIVEVPDERLDRLWREARGWSLEAGKEARTLKLDGSDSVKKVPAAIRFVDIAGLVKGAHKGEGLGNQFLAHIREVDVICHVVRDFEVPNVARAGGSSDPKSDIELVNTELILKDLETVEKSLKGISRAERLKKAKKIEVKLSAFEKIKTGLSEGRLAKDIRLSEKEEEAANELFLLTMKPMVYVKNVSDRAVKLSSHRDGDGREEWVTVTAKLEAEITELSLEERQEYLKELGIKGSGLDRLIKSCYKLLDLVTFFTIEGEKQVQAWPIKKSSTALEAAAMVHSDFAEKFIRAEVVGFEDLVNVGSPCRNFGESKFLEPEQSSVHGCASRRAISLWEKAREKGRVQVEGKGYVVKDGDVVRFKI